MGYRPYRGAVRTLEQAMFADFPVRVTCKECHHFRQLHAFNLVRQVGGKADAGKGRWKPRPFVAEELPAAEYIEAWGERTGDLYLNDSAFFSNVPELVWTYQLGGYPVLKKWLAYRQADRRDEQPLTDDERRWLRQIIQRVAALLAVGPQLNDLYQQTATNAFSAAELKIAH